ncbi:endonuclease VII domain-containing protein [Actinomadura atramentaria]|uniref:endonuclease VII domain-containing protein n=1 Tax=Actinomadura atramentaria TaxID=1990 RepID=UPI00039C436C|nr:endonuclease VII domain-containing protein [Actinomadura atramentaria]
MHVKTCRDCGETKAATEFWKRKASPDGLSLYCKKCFGLRNSTSYRGKQAALGKKTRPYRRHSDVPDGMKYCPRCQETKPVSEFGGNRSQPSGLAAYCRPCHNRVMSDNKQRLHGGQRNYLLKLRYGITAAQADDMRARQGRVCLICLDGSAVHVDHDHETGLVRGILCFSCNGALGQFDDDVHRMIEAADYLEKRTWYVRALQLELGTDRISGAVLRGWRAEQGVGSGRPGFDGGGRPLGREARRHYRLRRRYGLGAADVDALAAIQRGFCAVCSERPAENVDHCHRTGTVRGLLCGGCNTGMGQFRDDPAVLRRAAEYLCGSLVREVPAEDGGTRLSFTVPDVDPASVPPGGWGPYRRADAERRRAERDRQGVRESWIAVPAGVG